MPLFQGFRPVVGTICPSSAAAVVGPPRASQGMKKGRRPRRRPRLKLSDRAGPDQCPVPGENALFPAQIAGFLAVSRPVPVYPVFLNYVVPVQFELIKEIAAINGLEKKLTHVEYESRLNAARNAYKETKMAVGATSKEKYGDSKTYFLITGKQISEIVDMLVKGEKALSEIEVQQTDTDV